jgi:sigma-B regulation protein RsbU (phosphoserine phosphatase)
MKFFFREAAVAPAYRIPQPSAMPGLKTAEIGAAYVPARMGGDFYEFISAGDSRLVFTLLDIAGTREQAMHVAAAVQEKLRAGVPRLFPDDNINESDALAALTHELNREILSVAGGVRCSPAFLAVYREAIGTLSYCNAGHTPALLKDSAGIELLPAAGLPLGLFSHATYEPQVSVLQPGAVLLLGSRGAVESHRNGSGEEFGMDRLKQSLQSAEFLTAQDLCNNTLRDVEQFTGSAPAHNDATVISLLRRPVEG